MLYAISTSPFYCDILHLYNNFISRSYPMFKALKYNIILWLLHKFSNICRPEEGWYGQPKYCYKKQYTLF